MKNVTRVFLLFAAVCAVCGCSLVNPSARRSGGADSERSIGGRKADKRLAKMAIDMLDPASRGFNPEKGRGYLEYSLKHGNISTVEVPAPVLLELLKSERVALEKSRNLETQLEIMKAIDLQREEERQ